MKSLSIITAVLLLTGCCTTPPAPQCDPLPEMAVGQTLQEYTLDVVQRYKLCRGAP
ncbi:hypothetical protein CBM2626_A30030 [Cupriavidus taiwanensis]|uniref:hypothetical protein n=1 Tax=Cupriavidus taiwanensis TaxID=164546 RepID=UPI000E17237C|nr:hypothetical protein [Cupriavidus taiwanensis]SOZ99434.1 hypothetical protein CBM2626_A30030 [Cupriavidus taiwanensis]